MSLISSLLLPSRVCKSLRLDLVGSYDAEKGFPDSSFGKEAVCNAGDPRSIPGSGRFTGEGIGYPLPCSWVSLVAQLVRICLQCGRRGFDPWIAKIPWRRERLPTPIFWPGEFHGLYSPWGCKELDMTKFYFHVCDTGIVSGVSY